MKNPIDEPWGIPGLSPVAIRAFEPTPKFLQVTFQALALGVDYLQDHSPTLFDDRPPIEGDYEGAFEPKDGRGFAIWVLDERFPGRTEITVTEAAEALAKFTPPLPDDPSIAPFAVECIITNHVRNSVRRILNWLERMAREGPEAARPLVKQRLIEFTDARRLDLRFKLAENLIDTTVHALSKDPEESSAYLATIAADPLAPQWMIWRAQGVWYYDDNEDLHYGHRPKE